MNITKGVKTKLHSSIYFKRRQKEGKKLLLGLFAKHVTVVEGNANIVLVREGKETVHR